VKKWVVGGVLLIGVVVMGVVVWRSVNGQSYEMFMEERCQQVKNDYQAALVACGDGIGGRLCCEEAKLVYNRAYHRWCIASGLRELVRGQTESYRLDR